MRICPENNDTDTIIVTTPSGKGKKRKMGVRRGNYRAGVMVQQIKMLATRADDLSLIPRSYMASGENQFPQIVLHPVHMFARAYKHTH